MDENRQVERGNIIDGRLLRPDEHIYDLVDLVGEDNDGQRSEGPGPDDVVYDLRDVITEDYSEERPTQSTELHEETMRRVSEIAEKVAREVIPDIAERIIREEIEKLKKDL